MQVVTGGGGYPPAARGYPPAGGYAQQEGEILEPTIKVIRAADLRGCVPFQYPMVSPLLHLWLHSAWEAYDGCFHDGFVPQAGIPAPKSTSDVDTASETDLLTPRIHR